VIDASIAVRWLVDLPLSGQARSLLTYQNRLIAPDFLPVEVGSAPVRMLPVHPVAYSGLRAFRMSIASP
jgi:hypothetical protein